MPLVAEHDELTVTPTGGDDFVALVDRTVAHIKKRFPLIDCPVEHRFTDAGNGMSLYSRQITMPAGAVVVSERHMAQHQYIVSQGIVAVRSGDGTKIIEAPYHGITEPGTERILFIKAECIWTTFHLVPSEVTDPEEIKQRILAPRRPELK